jgi:hypothetical protein
MVPYATEPRLSTVPLPTMVRVTQKKIVYLGHGRSSNFYSRSCCCTLELSCRFVRSLFYMALGKVMVTTLQENQPGFPSGVLVDPQWVEGS